MELYQRVSRDLSMRLTLAYSSSFGLSSRLFGRRIRGDIFALYGFVRIADEIVDSYRGDDGTKRQLLRDLEKEVYDAIKRGYSANPIVYSFADMAARHGIDKELVAPFFKSMHMDIESHEFNETLYRQYVYGSAEVIGLMCLKVFCGKNTKQEALLHEGAAALGSAYQKVNFLRDMASDYRDLGRVYFPGVAYESFSEEQKAVIVEDITRDFVLARDALVQLPLSSRVAVATSMAYYQALLQKLKQASVSDIQRHRMRISTPRKLWLLCRTAIRELVRRT